MLLHMLSILLFSKLFTISTRASLNIYTQVGFFRETFVFEGIVVYIYGEELTTQIENLWPCDFRLSENTVSNIQKLHESFLGR